MPKKRKGFPILGAIVTVTVIGSALLRKGGAKDEVEFENGNGTTPPIQCPPGTHRNELGLCVPNVPVDPCGVQPPIPPTSNFGLDGYWFNRFNVNLGWSDNLVKKPVRSIVILKGAGFSNELIQWFSCKISAGTFF